MSKKLIRVRDIMKTDFDMVEGMSTVADALEKMHFVDTKTLIVNKRHDDDEYGIVTLSGIARHVLAVDRSPERTNIYEIMTKPALSVAPDMDIRYCARMFDHFKLTRAPVVENGKVIGIISVSDLVLKGMLKQD
ncbi:MAG: CBS domain-containing protein [Gammaproteobacteria bacterium]|jgi:predicted transcriptional regulator